MTTFSSASSSRQSHPTVRMARESDRTPLGSRVNVGDVERWVSGIAGAALVAQGLIHEPAVLSDLQRLPAGNQAR